MSNVQRTAVITGATSERGIGIDVARRYARAGWAVVVLDLDGEKSAKVAADIGNQYAVPAFGHAVDVTSEESVAVAHEAVAADVAAGHLPPVGALANIAGITSPVPFLDTTLELWNKVMAVNATGTYLVTKAFLPGMLDNGWGRIVNMSSVSAQRGGGVFGKVPYSSAKAAVLGFTKALAREVADSGVTVNAVTPGAVDTSIRVGSSDEQEAKLASDIPIGRVATTDEVAAVITFLCSPRYRGGESGRAAGAGILRTLHRCRHIDGGGTVDDVPGVRQSGRRRRRPRYAPGRRHRRVARRHRGRSARSGIGVRGRDGVPGAGRHRAATHRGADPGRHPRQRHPPVRTGLLGAAPTPEGRRTGAGPEHLRAIAVATVLGCGGLRTPDRLLVRGDRRIPRRQTRRPRVYRDESAHPGRTHGHRGDHRGRPGAGAAARRSGGDPR